MRSRRTGMSPPTAGGSSMVKRLSHFESLRECPKCGRERDQLWPVKYCMCAGCVGAGGQPRAGVEHMHVTCPCCGWATVEATRDAAPPPPPPPPTYEEQAEREVESWLQ